MSFEWVLEARRELAAEFEPRAQRALDQWPVQVDEIMLADVPCQRLLPKAAAPTSTVIYFFGGGHVSGCPEYDLPITASLCVQARLQVIAPRYALAPEHPYPAALDQARAIWPVICEAMGGRAPMLAGESAGGNLALALLQSLLADDHPLPPKLALLSPWCDLTPRGIALSADIRDPSLPASRVGHYADAYMQGASAADPLISPLKGHVPPDWPATHLTTGSLDALRPTVLALHEKLDAADVPVTLTDAPDMWHVFEAYDEAPGAARSLEIIAKFLNS